MSFSGASRAVGTLPVYTPSGEDRGLPRRRVVP